MNENKAKLNEIKKLFQEFEDCKQMSEGGVEYWSARDLQVLLDYSSWRDFCSLIEKAKIACSSSGIKVTDHFVVQRKMVDIGSGTQREVDDYILNRYSCYLIAMNGSSSKERISFAQTYFAIQTRKLEVIQERLEIKERLDAREKLRKSESDLSTVVYERGFEDKDFAYMRSKGDEALFGVPTDEMKKKLGVKKGRPLADFVDTVIIKAKDLAAAMTVYNTTNKNIHGVVTITKEHVTNNTSVRKTLEARGITPSNLPPKEDIKIVERRLKSEEENRFIELSKITIELPKPNDKNKEVKINIFNDLWIYALYIMYNSRFGIATMEEIYNGIIKVIPNIPNEYLEKSKNKNGDNKLKQIVKKLKSNKKNNFINQGYALINKNEFQITKKGIEFVEYYFRDYIK